MLNKKNKIIYICIAVILLGGLFHFARQKKESKTIEQQQQKQGQEDFKNISYNQVFLPSESINRRTLEGKTIKWQAKISAYYSQLDGIKFCIVDEEHQNVDIGKKCDWFWAFSDELMGANDLSVNPNWDGRWVPYTLNYYKVPFDKDTRYYDDIYTVEGKINSVECDGDPKNESIDKYCYIDVGIINITRQDLLPNLIQANRKFEDSIKNDYTEIVYGEGVDYYSDFEKVQTISTGEYELKINNPKGDFFGDGGKGFLSIYKNGKFDRKLDYKWSIVEVDNFKFNKAEYFLLNRYSGGAGMHKNQFIINKYSALQVGKEFYAMRSEVKETFEKDGQVYLLVAYTGLEYDLLGGRNWFPIFYRIDSQSANFILSNNEFSKYYQQLAIDIDSAIRVAKKDSVSGLEADKEGPIYSALAYRLLIRILAGENIETAKKEFVDDGKHFFKDGKIDKAGTTAEASADHIIERITSLDKDQEVPAEFL